MELTDDRMRYDIFVLRPNGPLSHEDVLDVGKDLTVDSQRIEIIATTQGISDGADKSLLCIAHPLDENLGS